MRAYTVFFAAVLVFAPVVSSAQTYTIPDLYDQLPGIIGVDVTVEGYYTNPEDSMLVVDYDVYEDDETPPPHFIVYLDGPPAPVAAWYGGWVEISGTVDVIEIEDPIWPEDDPQIILRNISYRSVRPRLTDPADTEIFEETRDGGFTPFRADCDSCKFAILVSGGGNHNYRRYWNNIEMLYRLKVDSLGYCPHNVFVLYWKGNSGNAASIPNDAVDSCTVAKVQAAHREVARRIAACHRRGKKSTLQSLVTDHGRNNGGIRMLGRETMTPQQYRALVQTCIDSCLSNLRVEMVQCYGGQAADSLRALNDRMKTKMHTTSAAGGSKKHRSDSRHANGGWATFIKRKVDALKAGRSYEEAVRKGLAAYDSLLESRGLEDRRKKSVNWRSYPMGKYCEWQEIEVPPGGQLIMDFSGDSTSCGNCTVYKKVNGRWVRVKTYNWNVEGSAGYTAGNKRRVVNADAGSATVFRVHNDDGRFRLIAATTETQALAESPSNVHVYAGASAGGDDDSGYEFNPDLGPYVTAYGLSDDGFELDQLPRYIGVGGTERLEVSYTWYENEWWEDMEMVIDVAEVFDPGELRIDTGSDNPSAVLWLDEPGTYVVPLGFVWGDFIIFNGFGPGEPRDRQLMASFEFDSWGLRVASAMTDVQAEQGAQRLRRPLTIAFANPYPAGSAIQFAIDHGSLVRLSVFDVRGRRVATLVDGVLSPGSHTVHWDGRGAGGRSLASGVYFVRLAVGGEAVTTKMLVLE